jgi:hypothetical protein
MEPVQGLEIDRNHTWHVMPWSRSYALKSTGIFPAPPVYGGAGITHGKNMERTWKKLNEHN